MTVQQERVDSIRRRLAAEQASFDSDIAEVGGADRRDASRRASLQRASIGADKAYLTLQLSHLDVTHSSMRYDGYRGANIPLAP